ncbi:MAG: UvrB/UvrC motif-containing protein [Spirochaetales bacterium]|nr:UvrB/UvrC motif-containing protein [Spirochaetales bacterium]
MKCDICKKRDAVFHMQEQSAMGVRKISLCVECALTKGLNIRAEDIDKLFASFISNIFAEGQTSPVNIASQTAARILILKCPECGRSLEDITKTNEVGCPKCFSYFKNVIDAMLANMNNSINYRGNFPTDLRTKHDYRVEIFNLKKQLKQCVSMEDFDKAAEIRDKIKALQDGENTDDKTEEK